MTSERWIGVRPRSGRGVIAAGVIVLNSISFGVPDAMAAKAQSIDFHGELDYETFKRASSRGVGIRIKSSPGGTGAAAMVLGRAQGLVIDGTCNSACAWAFVRNTKACFTRRASFGFHGAHDPGTGRRLTAATDYWLSTVGPALRARLARLRTSSGIVRVSAREMMRYYGDRLCGAASPRVQVAEANTPKEQTGEPRLETQSRAPAAARPASVAPGSRATPVEPLPVIGPAVAATAITEADSLAAAEALRQTAFERDSVIITSHLLGNAAHMVAIEETNVAQPEAASVGEAHTAESNAPREGILSEVMPSLGLDFRAQATSDLPSATSIVWGGVLASTTGNGALPDTLEPSARPAPMDRADAGSIASGNGGAI